ncbi:Nucleosome-remodeling factor subunit [Thelohanellus kitauei]|uniref:Nucleosome-remodeling factor subunit n=1 Tax=Thelohanellus kitauei TaxID=669202 RepID=A0A0C2I8B9_THEKT|nr:Nucleosome-remodeling factor subunit [Thelohanellus kitauei]
MNSKDNDTPSNPEDDTGSQIRAQFPPIPIVHRNFTNDTRPTFAQWHPRAMDQHFTIRPVPESTFADPKNFPIQSPKNIIRPDYETPHVYPYLQSINSRNFPAFSALSVPQPTSFNPPSGFQFRPTYINGCGQYQPNLPAMDAAKRGPALPIPQVNKLNALSEHSYGGLSSFPVKPEFHKTPTVIQSLPAVKRNSLQSDSFSGENFDLPTDKPPVKKKKNYHPSRDSIQKAIDAGFMREVNKFQTENGDTKRSVTYKAPDGTILSKKNDVKAFLTNHPEIDLKHENFSFDTRISMNPRKTKDQPSDNNKSLASVQKSPSVNKSNISKPKIITKVLENSGLKPSPVKKNDKKPLSVKNRKMITKYFKKLLDDTKYFEGLSSGSYRRKMINLTRINFVSKANTKLLTEEALHLFQNVFVIYEFLRNFSQQLNLDVCVTNIIDVVEFLDIRDVKNSTYCHLFSQLLLILIKHDNFAHELHHSYMMDNVFAIDWNWLFVHDIFRRYMESKKGLMIYQPLDDSVYHEYWIKILDYTTSDEFIYCAKPDLRAFVLRFLIDQAVTMSPLTSIINKYVDNISKYKREKFHVETRIRQLKYKLTTSTQKNGVKEDDRPDSAENGEETKDNEVSDINQCQNELDECELEKDSLRKSIIHANSIIRSAFLGWDRFDREYQYSDNQKSILVEALADQKGIAQNKFMFKSSARFKLQIPDGCENDELLGMSNQFIEKIDVSLDDFVFSQCSAFIENPKNVTTESQKIVQDVSKKQELLNILIHYPKLVKNMSEDEFEQFIDVFNKNLIKYKKKTPSSHEYGKGWWEIKDRNTFQEFTKSLSQKGYKEQNLYKSINRCQEVFANFPESLKPNENEVENSVFLNFDESANASQSELREIAMSLIQQEIGQISQKMDSYLQKLNVVVEPTFEIHSNNLTLKLEDCKEVLKNMVQIFLQHCDKKFDKNWAVRWCEHFSTVENLESIYSLCLSLKIKINPNCKICKICNQVNDSLAILECGNCQLSAHEPCLPSPMKKLKKVKLMCSSCYAEHVEKSQRICKKCSAKHGKTINCSSCNEYYHLKCCTNKPKSKNDPLICDTCSNVAKEPGPRVYKRPEFPFKSVSFKMLEKEIINLLKKIKQSKDSEPFLEPVDRSVPEYYDIIKKPMDLKIISNKIKNKKYKTVNQFFNDMIQIFENCYIFNEDNSLVAKCGTRLQKLFLRELNSITSLFK